MCGIVGAVSTRNIVPILVAGPAAPGVPRLRLLRRCGRQCRRPAARAQHRPRRRTAGAGRSEQHPAAAPASPTRAGPRTACRRCTTRIRTSATARRRRRPARRIALVHNGIIENHDELRAALTGQGLRASPARPTPRSSRTWSTASTSGDLFDAVKARHRASCTAPTPSPCSARTSRTAWSARAQGSPLVLGVGERRELPRQRCDGAGRRHRPDRLPGRRRRGRPAAGRATGSWTADGKRGDRAPVQDSAGPQRRGRTGPVPPLHAKGNLRAAARHGRHAAKACTASCPELFGAARTAVFKEIDSRADPGLRHQLLQRLHRQVLAGGHREDPDAGRDRQRIPLPRQRAEPEHAGRHDHRSPAKPPTRWPR